MTVIVLTGIQAAGKSTIGQALAESFNRGVHLRGDVFRRMIASGREDMSAAPSPEAVEQLHLRYRLAGAAAQGYVDAGFTVVLQDVALGEHFSRFVAAAPAPRHVVVLCPRAEVVAGRDAERQAIRGKVAYRDGLTVADLDTELRENTPRHGLWLDTSDLTVAQNVAAIRSYVESASGPDHPLGGVERVLRDGLLTPARTVKRNDLPPPVTTRRSVLELLEESRGRY